MNSCLNKRISELDAVLSLIGLIELRISCFLEPLDSLLCVLRAEFPLFSSAEGEDFHTVWADIFSSETRMLKRGEREVILSFGNELGRSDLEGQMSLCRATERRLRLFRENAVGEKEKYASLVGVLPVFVGTTLILLLL